MKPTKYDRALAWAILHDLADRRGIPDWLGNKHDEAARLVHKGVSEVIAKHREEGQGTT